MSPKDPTSIARHIFACGLACWAMYAIPFQFIGMGQILFRSDDRPLSFFEMSFVAGGCCIAPLVILMNIYWAYGCWRVGAKQMASVLGALALISYWAAHLGVG